MRNPERVEPDEATALAGGRLLLRPSEVAAMLGLGKTKIYELMATGELAWVPIGRRGRRVEPRAVQEFIERRRTAVTPVGEADEWPPTLTTDVGKPWSRSGAARPSTLRSAS